MTLGFHRSAKRVNFCSKLTAWYFIRALQLVFNKRCSRTPSFTLTRTKKLPNCLTQIILRYGGRSPSITLITSRSATQRVAATSRPKARSVRAAITATRTRKSSSLESGCLLAGTEEGQRTGRRISLRRLRKRGDPAPSYIESGSYENHASAQLLIALCPHHFSKVPGLLPIH